MKKLPAYSVQYNKILNAYFNDKIEPFNANFCFCGTLAAMDMNGSRFTCEWITNEYTAKQLENMEYALLKTISNETYPDAGVLHSFLTINHVTTFKSQHPNYENALFNGMVAALEVLKKIHIESGENVDNVYHLPHRSLQTVC